MNTAYIADTTETARVRGRETLWFATQAVHDHFPDLTEQERIPLIAALMQSIAIEALSGSVEALESALGKARLE